MSPQKKTLRETALETQKHNPSQLGDPVSLKAETSNTSPTSQDRGSSSPSSTSASSIEEDLSRTAPAPTGGDQDTVKGGNSKGENGKGGHQTLRQKAIQKLEENPSLLGDPVSLKAGNADSRPTDQDRGAAAGKPKL